MTFDIDANGIVSVSAKDKATGKEQSIKITASSGLSQTEIDRAIQDAERNAAEDVGKRELVDARNAADALIYATEKSMGDTQGHLDSGAVRDVQEVIGELKSALAGTDTGRIKTLTQRLESLAHSMAASAYNTGGDANTPGAGTASGGQHRSADDDVVDAEFQEVA